jgi:RimJ/RimL family protein N-acetyltransferase
MRVPVQWVSSAVARRLTAIFYQYTDYRVYRYELNASSELESPIRFKKNSFEDLEKFVPTERWHDRQQMLADWRTRLQGGWYVYTYCNDTTLLHYGWIRPQIRLYLLYEVGQKFSFPAASAGLWDFYTHPAARGRGFYQQNLKTMLYDLGNNNTHRYAYIGVVANNRPSRHVIEKVGFEYRGSVIRQRVFGRTRSWSSFPYADTGIE